jgi:uncharacterized alkaline shock family protein YloU
MRRWWNGDVGVDEMEEDHGAITIAPGVLATIARLTALTVPGVTRMGQSPTPRPNRLLRREAVEDGIRILVDDGMVLVDLHLIVERNVNMHQLAQQVQVDVTRAIQDMVGMAVREVNVHIQDVEMLPDEAISSAQEGEG